MKKLRNLLLLILLQFLALQTALAQGGQNEFEKRRLNASLTKDDLVIKLITSLNSDNNDVFTDVKALLDPQSFELTPIKGGTNQSDITALGSAIYATFGKIDNGDNAAIILVYRKFLVATGAGGGATTYNPDLANTITKVYHKKNKGADLGSYLLATKKVYFVFIDIGNSYYETNKDKSDSKLSASVIKINYKKSYSRQSLDAGAKVWGLMGGANGTDLNLTLVEMEPGRIKDPCDILVTNKSFKADLTFTVHEKNVTSFQVGLVNNKYTVSDVSITGGNLVVKPSTDQSKTWKSNAYALFEIHLPRDIDNSRPLWTTLFHKSDDDKKRTAGGWFIDNFASRIGIYGGVKMSKDPLAGLFAGFNYALTKELAINLGWAWTNEYQNQVTAVGDISSLDDALKYAKRKYSSGKFSVGLSFSPTVVLDTWGLK